MYPVIKHATKTTRKDALCHAPRQPWPGPLALSACFLSWSLWDTGLGGETGGKKKEQVTVTLVTEGSVITGQGKAPFQSPAEEAEDWGPEAMRAPL